VRDRHVVLIGFDGFQALDLVGPLEVFSKANSYAPPNGPAPFNYVVTIASPAGGEIAAESGLRIGTSPIADLPSDLDTVLVAGGTSSALERVERSGELTRWLVDHAGTIRRLGSVCTGVFLIAATGLLDGRRATTHWQLLDRLREVHPGINVESDALFVEDGKFYTSAGVSAGIDLSLALVEQDLGPEVALAVSRELVLFLRRPGGQSQFSASLAAQARTSGKLGTLLLWIADHPEADLSLPLLAERAAMSERNFGRVFARLTGMTPARYVESVRIDRAKLYLETTEWPLARVAQRSGFGSVATLIRAFARRIGATPDDYRQRFSLNPNWREVQII
jgi:transcriptional regulator GlxA family with amidase domain